MLPIARSVASSSSIFWFIDNDIIQFIVIPRELSRSWRSAAHDAITGIHFSLKYISLINRCVLKTPWVAIWYLRNLRLGSGCLLAWARFIHPTIYDTLRILNDDASVRYLASARFRTDTEPIEEEISMNCTFFPLIWKLRKLKFQRILYLRHVVRGAPNYFP